MTSTLSKFQFHNTVLSSVKVKVTQSCPSLWNFQARILEWVAFPFSRGSSQPRDRTQGSCIVDRFFTNPEPQGKPKNTVVGSPSLLQRIFMTQELNQALLHCRWILYQLSYQGSPLSTVTMIYIRSSDFIHVITEILYTLTSSYFSCIPPSPSFPTDLVLALLFGVF